MEAAYGLAITITMLMTTILLSFYLHQKRPRGIQWLLLAVPFLSIESMFFLGSVSKFFKGGYVVVLMTLVLLIIMSIWKKGSNYKLQGAETVDIRCYLDQLDELREDESIPLLQTNCVFMVPKIVGYNINADVMYSILDKRPKRAKVYWFVNIALTNEPYTCEYQVDTLDTDFVVMVRLRLGFRMKQQVNVYLKQILNDLVEEGTLPKQRQKYSVCHGREIGDFAFVMIHQMASSNENWKWYQYMILKMRFLIKKHTVTPALWYGLEFDEIWEEDVTFRHKKAADRYQRKPNDPIIQRVSL